MNCSNCGCEIPAGQAFCSYCGTPAPADMGMQGTYGAAQPYDQMYSQPYAQSYEAAPAKKSKKALIIGLIAGVVAIAAVVLVLVMFVFGKGADGTYVCNEYALFGIEMELEIDGDEFVLSATYDGETETVEGTCKVDGDEIILTSDGEDVTCEYDEKEGTINMEGVTFTKE